MTNGRRIDYQNLTYKKVAEGPPTRRSHLFPDKLLSGDWYRVEVEGSHVRTTEQAFRAWAKQRGFKGSAYKDPNGGALFLRVVGKREGS